MADQPTSRRSFLFGRSLRQEDPWLRFLARLKRSCEGPVSLVRREGAALARLVPIRQADVLHARALCHEYGVCMALEGVPLGVAEQARPVLLVEAGQAWANASALGDGLWRVDAGCPLAVMRVMGMVGVDEASQTQVPVQNLAQWLSMLHVTVGIGALGGYGIHAIECLYADGSIEVVGPFGVKDSQPLRSLAAQRSIPALFQLTMDARLQALLQPMSAGQWPLPYRLDALMGAAGVAVNLAHLLLGHRGSLGWVLAAHVHTDAALNVPDVALWRAPTLGVAQQQTVAALTAVVKQAMDPSGLFMSTPC